MIDLIASIFYTNTKFNLITCFKAKFSYTVLSKSVSRTKDSPPFRREKKETKEARCAESGEALRHGPQFP